MIERRQFKRISQAAIVRYRFRRSHLGMSSRSEDICEQGMRLVTLQRLETGLTLDINFQLEDHGENISATGKIVWQCDRENAHYPFAVGLKFVKMNQADKEKIRDYIVKKAYNEKPLGVSYH